MFDNEGEFKHFCPKSLFILSIFRPRESLLKFPLTFFLTFLQFSFSHFQNWQQSNFL